jgi:hypothetical protein
MAEGGWPRWILGLAVASVIPIALGGGACGGKDTSPEPSAGVAGMPAASGTSTGGSSPAGASGSSTGGSSTGGTGGSSTGRGGTGSTGSSSAGGSSAGGGAAGYSSSGGASSGAAGASCCTPGETAACTPDGQSLSSCLIAAGGACRPSAPGIYAYVWALQACPNGCADGGTGGTGSHCR